MWKYAVSTPFSFVGFALTKRLLEMGESVSAFYIPKTASLPYIEEIEMYLGRNSNFSFLEKKDRKKLSFDTFFCTGDEQSEDAEILMEFNNASFNTLVFIHDEIPSTHLILPFKLNNRIEIVLPAIYGPFQPKSGFFQSCLENNGFPFEQYEREAKWDAIFIDDAVSGILSIAKIESGTYRIYSGIEKHWDLLLRNLGYEVLYESCQEGSRKQLDDADTYIPFSIEEATTPAEGIAKQREYMVKSLEMKNKWS